MANGNVNNFRSLIGPYTPYFVGDESYFIPSAAPDMSSLALACEVQAQVLPTSSTTVFNASTQFQLNQQIPVVKRLVLEFSIGPISVTGGTYVRFTNDWVFWLIKQIQLRDPSGGLIQNYFPEWQFARFVNLPLALQEYWRQNFRLEDSNASRSTLAATGVTNMQYELPMWWNERPNNAYVLQNIDAPQILQLDFNDLASIIETDGTNPTATLTCSIILVGRIPTESERNMTAGVLNDERGALYDATNYFPTEVGIVPAATLGDIQFNIDQIKGPISRLDFWCRPNSSVHGNTANPITSRPTDFTFACKPQQIAILTGTEYIQQQTPIYRLIFDDRKAKFPCSSPDTRLIIISFAEFPELFLSLNSGIYDFNFIGKPVARLTYSVAPGVDTNILVGALSTALIQHQGGRIQQVMKP